MQHPQQLNLSRPAERQAAAFVQLGPRRHAVADRGGAQSRVQPGNSESKGRGQAEINLNHIMSTSLTNP